MPACSKANDCFYVHSRIVSSIGKYLNLSSNGGFKEENITLSYNFKYTANIDHAMKEESSCVERRIPPLLAFYIEFDFCF